MATNEPAYSASKGGVFAMMRVMAIDYAREGIRVNMIVPGFIEPHERAGDARRRRIRYWTDQIPIGRAGTPKNAPRRFSGWRRTRRRIALGTALVVDGGQAVDLKAW